MRLFTGRTMRGLADRIEAEFKVARKPGCLFHHVHVERWPIREAVPRDCISSLKRVRDALQSELPSDYHVDVWVWDAVAGETEQDQLDHERALAENGGDALLVSHIRNNITWSLRVVRFPSVEDRTAWQIYGDELDHGQYAEPKGDDAGLIAGIKASIFGPLA